MFFLGDGATGFGGVFWPEFFGEDGVGDEAGLEGDCLDGLEVDRGGGAADVEGLEEVAARGVRERGKTQFSHLLLENSLNFRSKVEAQPVLAKVQIILSQFIFLLIFYVVEVEKT